MNSELIEWYSNIDSLRADEVKLDFAVQLAAAIDERKITRQEYSRLVGVSGARITKALRGDTNLTIDSMDKLASAVGRDIHIKLARKGSKIHFFEVISSRENSFQSINNKSPYVTAGKTYSGEKLDINNELVAL